MDTSTARLSQERFEAVDYHRNGIGGLGFYVGIYRDPADDGRKLVVYFPDSPEIAVAVIDVEQAAKGNIYMHPQPEDEDKGYRGPVKPNTGGNAWRGDHYFDVAKRIVTLVEGIAQRRLGRMQ